MTQTPAETTTEATTGIPAPSQQTALILGARGKIGRHFARAFQDAGWQTRIYTRGTDMNAAAQGCDVIVNGLNPPNYHDWATILPAITTQVLDAARASGATILFPGNVYVFGDQPGPWDETTPHRPVSRKGAIRVEVEGRYRAAAADGVQTILLRAGDFIDPDTSESVLDMVYLRRLGSGVITSGGDPAAERAYAYLPDMARAAVALAEKRAELPAFTDVPYDGLTFSVTELKAALERETGRKLRVAQFPWWLLKLSSPVWELGREMSEMRYLYTTPHRLSGTRLQALLPGFRSKPLGEVLRIVLARREGLAAAA